MAKSSSISSDTVPGPALVLGAAGLIPFVGGLLFGFLDVAETGDAWLSAVRLYGACILSFMGGIHWGLAIQPAAPETSYRRLGASVVWALIAWLALLLPMAPGFAVLAAAFAALLAYDLAEVSAGRAPPWYPKLRIPLTAFVVLCLLLAPLA